MYTVGNLRKRIIAVPDDTPVLAVDTRNGSEHNLSTAYREGPMTWKRHGECNHCGFCCLFLSNTEIELNTTKKDLAPPDGEIDEQHLAVRGFEQREGDAYSGKALFYSPCREFNLHELRCNIQATKPKLCVEFPTQPEQVLGTPCSYYFEECADGHAARMGGDQSPYPGRTFEKNGIQFKDLTPYPIVRYPLILPRHVEVKS